MWLPEWFASVTQEAIDAIAFRGRCDSLRSRRYSRRKGVVAVIVQVPKCLQRCIASVAVHFAIGVTPSTQADGSVKSREDGHPRSVRRHWFLVRWTQKSGTQLCASRCLRVFFAMSEGCRTHCFPRLYPFSLLALVRRISFGVKVFHAASGKYLRLPADFFPLDVRHFSRPHRRRRFSRSAEPTYVPPLRL